MNATRRILTIEDDAAIRRGIVDALTFAGFQVLQTGNGRVETWRRLDR
jgi:DNA-binding response OmpR family regulator